MGGTVAIRSTFAGERRRADGRRPALDDHRHAEPGTERDERPRLDRVSGYEVQPVALGERGQAQLRFYQREVVADALTRSGAKRQIGELRSIGAALRRKALWIERLRILPERGEPMQHVRDDECEPSPGKTEPAQRVVCKRLP